MSSNAAPSQAGDGLALPPVAAKESVSGPETSEFQKELGRTLGHLAAQLAPERIGSGALAEIRRMTTSSPPPAFWRLYLSVVPSGLRHTEMSRDDRRDLAWARLIRAMAESVGPSLRPAPSLGTALMRTGYSEPRFVRLLRAGGDDLGRELRVAARWLATKGATPDWWLPAQLLFGRPPTGLPVNAERAERRLASDYFREQARS